MFVSGAGARARCPRFGSATRARGPGRSFRSLGNSLRSFDDEADDDDDDDKGSGADDDDLLFPDTEKPPSVTIAPEIERFGSDG